MFLRIALMDARTLQKIVDVVQRPELYIDAAEDVEDTAELESAQVPTEEAASIEGQTSAENAEEAPPSRVKKTVRIAAEAPRLTSPRADVCVLSSLFFIYMHV